MAKRRYGYYAILGVSKDASQEGIKQAYLKLAKEFHPDVNSAPDSNDKFKKINEAYQVLGDQIVRSEYDASPAECPVCYTHEVIQTVELLYRCRHCGCQFDNSQNTNIIEKVERTGIPEKLREAVRGFQTTQCSWCLKFYTNEPFQCPFGRLQSNCVSIDKLTDNDRKRLLGDEKWWWRMGDMLKQVEDKGIMAKCRVCFSLNPNPQKINCWNCNKDGLTCPGCIEKPFLRYDMAGDVWKCINNSHGKSYKYVQKKSAPKYILSQEKCPNCKQNLYWDEELWLFRCQAKGCKRIYTYQDLGRQSPYSDLPHEAKKEQTPGNVSGGEKPKAPRVQMFDYLTRPWFLALLLVFTLSIVGVVISLILGNSSPFFILICVSIIFSIEHWFYYKTVQRSITCRPYKLFLNLFSLYLLFLIILSAIKLFSQKLLQSPLAGSILFIAELIIFALIIKVLRKHHTRWPSMKLTIFGLVAITLILSFAGVEPFSEYKTRIFNSVSSWFASIPEISDTQTKITVSGSNEQLSGARPTSEASQPVLTTPNEINLDQLELQVHELINSERIKNGLNPLNWSSTLNEIAEGHSRDMASRNYFSHESPEGFDLMYRYQAGGFVVGIGAAENIFQSNLVESRWYINGIPTFTDRYTQDELARQAVESWMGSPGHRQNILTPYWQVEGIGIAISPSGEVYFTQDFG